MTNDRELAHRNRILEMALDTALTVGDRENEMVKDLIKVLLCPGIPVAVADRVCEVIETSKAETQAMVAKLRADIAADRLLHLRGEPRTTKGLN